MNKSTNSKSLLSEVIKQEFSLNDAEKIAAEIKKYQYALIWRTDRVDFISAGDIVDIDKMIELRAFNEESELHLTKYNDKYIGRIRRDCSGAEVECYDDLCLLWGKPESTEGNTTWLYEDRGIRLNVPVIVETNQRAFLQIRSYLKNDVFEFDDYRIVGITAKEAAANE